MKNNAKRVRGDLQGVRSARLGLRATQAQVALIQRAAEAKGKSVTEFVLSSACEKAEQTLSDQTYYLVSEEAWKKFHDALERPPKVTEGLLRLLTEPDIWENEE